MGRGRGRGRGRGGRGRGGATEASGGSDDENEETNKTEEEEQAAEERAVAEKKQMEFRDLSKLNPNMYDSEGKRKESGAMVTFAKPNYHKGTRDIYVEKIDLTYKGHTVLENATLSLVMGKKYGLVAPNGAGKTSLLKVLGVGEIPFPEGSDWFFLDREVAASTETSAIQAVLASNVEKELLEKELEQLLLMDQDDEEVLSRLDMIYTRLDELDAESAESRAAKILFGLGFTTEMQNRPTASFSGGWRMRISLAQALFQNPSLLIMDGPTNHLDVEAVVWLEQYLVGFKKCIIMVSHSQDFMNSVCTNIIHMHKGRLNVYDGNYDMYCIVREEKESHQMKRYQWQQGQIKSMKDYIARFGHGHKKLARQAQSKEKTLEKMTRGGLETTVTKDRDVTFLFPCAGTLPPPIIQFTDVKFNYPGCKTLLKIKSWGLDLDSRITICGKNGEGKTTLLKLITRELEATEGYVAKNAHCTIARFHQHFADQIDGDLSPLQFMQKEYPEIITPEPLRAALGRMGIGGKLQGAPIKTLSDGQKTRVVFAWMAKKEPHMIILDEPTNHLDMESIDALADALSVFEGAVIVVSHDLRLIAQVSDEIWVVDKGELSKFPGDIADYKEHIEKEVARMGREFAKGNKGGGSSKQSTSNTVAATGSTVTVTKKKTSSAAAAVASAATPSSSTASASASAAVVAPKQERKQEEEKEPEEEKPKSSYVPPHKRLVCDDVEGF